MTVQRIDTLLSCLYDSVLLPDGFQSFIAALVELFRLDAALLLTTHLDTRDIRGIWMQGLPPESISHFVREHAAQEVPPFRAQACPVTVLHMPGVDGYPEANPMNGAACLVGAIVLRDGPWFTRVILQRSRARPPFGPEELELFNRLMPHVQRSIRMRHRQGDSRRDSGFLAGCMNLIPMPVLLVGEACRIVHANQLAAALLHERGELWKEEGQLRSRVGVMQRLNEEIASVLAAGGRNKAASPAIVAVPRAGRSNLAVLVSPLLAEGAVVAGDAALLLVFDPEAAPQVAAGVIQRLFGLSEAEAQLAAILCGRQTLEEASAERGTSVNTVRSQVKSIFGKTGTNRQADLVSLLLASPAYLFARQ